MSKAVEFNAKGKVESISEAYYHELESSYLGVCLECGEERSMCEPDAEDYDCESCGENAVQGSLHFVICGMLH